MTTDAERQAAIDALYASLGDAPERGNGHRRSTDGWAEKLIGAPEGQRRAVALEIAGHYLGLRIAAEEVEAILRGYAARCTPPFPEREARELVRDLARRDRAKAPPDSGEPAGAAEDAAKRQAVILHAAEIPPERITWLWPGRLAVGALTNLVGLPDQGKTLVFCDIAARLTTGAPMPPAPHRQDGEPQRVLILTLEDSLPHTIVPRLAQAGADLGRVDFLRQVREPDGTLSLLTLAHDLDALAGALEGRRYALLIVDGIAGYLGDAKTHHDAEVRRVLTPFTELLDRAQVAGLSTMHPPKAITNLSYFAGGSVAFTAVPRVTLGAAPDPEDESESPRRLLMKLKGNLYGAVPTLAYRIAAESPAAVPWIDWAPGTVTVDIADVLDPVRESPEDRSTRRGCREWLRAYLGDGPRSSREVEAAAKDAGFKPRTIDRAKRGLVDSVKRGLGGWDWILRGP
ncbi:MAG: AAA family ATPase [Burkholderiales bacterium]